MRSHMSHDLFRHNSFTFDMSHSKNRIHINFRPLRSTASIPQPMCVCVCMRARACVHARVCICVYVCLCVYVCTCMCACMCVCVWLLVRVCVRVRVYEWVCVGEFVTQSGWGGRSPHLHHAGTHCNTLQHTATHGIVRSHPVPMSPQESVGTLNPNHYHEFVGSALWCSLCCSKVYGEMKS